MASDAEGHVLGNFHAYYSFNPVRERLRFMDAGMSRALREALLLPRGEGGAESSATVIDIGCNEGDLTIGLYRALAGQPPQEKEAEAADQEMDDVRRFDENSASVLNEKMQREKRCVEFVFTDEGGSGHRKHFAVELRIDGEVMGTGEGVSKKVAKAKAADAALRLLAAADAQEDACDRNKDGDARSQLENGAPPDAQNCNSTELAERRPLSILGVDIDGVLIARANGKKEKAAIAEGDTVQFHCVDVMTASFEKQISAFMEQAKRSPTAPRKFDIVTCFSVTMWIHLNHGDEGLWRFLGTVSDMTEHLLVELQPWKSYRNALKRLGRLGVAAPKSFRELKVRADVVDKMDAFLLAAGRFRCKADLGKTNWSRPVVLYSRRAIPGIAYAER